MATTKEMKFKLLNNNLIPLVGFGTWTLQGEAGVKTALNHALGAGYRLFDTAAMYGNESDIGKALKELLPKYNLTREDVFITTKLYPDDHGHKAYKAMQESLKKLNCEYIDLYLIHWPGAYGVSSSSPENAKLRDISWQEMVKGVENGLVRNIGVSNYNVRQLNQLLANNHGIKPVVNQMEWHPFCHQKDLLELCRKEGILLQAYMPLGGTGNKDLLENNVVKNIAKKLNRTSAQVLLRWSVQQNISVIPKSRSKEHIYSNIELDFNIPEEDMQTLMGLDQTKYDWDPDTIA